MLLTNFIGNLKSSRKVIEVRPKNLEGIIELFLNLLEEGIDAILDSTLLELLLLRFQRRIGIRWPSLLLAGSFNALGPDSGHLRDIVPGEGNNEQLVVRRELSLGGCLEIGSNLESIQSEHRCLLLLLWGETGGMRTLHL